MVNERSSWDQFFLDMADFVANKSKDPSTKIGAVLVGNNNEVLSIGYNGFPRKVEDTSEDRYTRPIKYRYTVHAEQNALFNAARNGIRVNGAKLYLNVAPVPCTECTKAVIQSGVSEIISPIHTSMGSRWDDDLSIADTMLQEAGMKVRVV